MPAKSTALKLPFSFPVLSLSLLAIAAICLALLLPLVACAPAEEAGKKTKEKSADQPPEAEKASSFASEAAILESVDPAFDALFPAETKIEILAEGFTWSEGPVWVPGGKFLLFSDVPQDTIYRWRAEDGLTPWIKPSGHTNDEPRGREPGANGLFLDAGGHLLLCQHGDRRVARLEGDVAAGPFVDAPAPLETIVGDFEGKRFNSPNDLVLRGDGTIFFTDPPYGLRDEEARELPHHGVYSVQESGGPARLLYADLTRPNGVQLSPDGKTLFVANSDPEKALWMRWPILEGGDLGEGEMLHDATAQVSEERPGLPDGMAVDKDGRLYATGPGGLWVFDGEGRHLGTLRLPHATANVAFGEDGSSLFLTSHHRLLRVRVAAVGVGF